MIEIDCTALAGVRGGDNKPANERSTAIQKEMAACDKEAWPRICKYGVMLTHGARTYP